MLRKVSASGKIKSATTSGASTGGSTWYPEPEGDLYVPELLNNINPYKYEVDHVSTSDDIMDGIQLQRLQKIKTTYSKKIKELQIALRNEQIAKDEILKLCYNLNERQTDDQGIHLQNQSYYEKKISRISNNVKKLSKKLETYQLKLKEIEDSNSDYTKLSDSSTHERFELKKDSLNKEDTNNDLNKSASPHLNVHIGREELISRHRHHSAEAISSLGLDQFYLQGDRQSDQNYRNTTKLEALRKIQLKITEDILDLQKELNENQSIYRNVFDELKMRIDQIEDQINDLTEIHQYEVFNIKQELTSLEEKIEYQLEERTSDLHELLESCQTKISKLELQQQQQQQLLSMESFDNTTFPLLIVKLINVVLAFFAVIFVLINTIVALLRPFFQSRLRTIISLASIFGCLIMWHLILHNSILDLPK